MRLRDRNEVGVTGRVARVRRRRDRDDLGAGAVPGEGNGVAGRVRARHHAILPRGLPGVGDGPRGRGRADGGDEGGVAC